MFIEFKQKIAKDYTILTGALLLCVSLCIYAASLSISYDDQRHQLRMLAVEESEEFFYQISSGKIDEFSGDDLPDSDPGYFSRIFIYAFNGSGQRVFSHNNIDWSRPALEQAMRSDLPYKEAQFKFEMLDGRHPKAMLFMRYPLQKDGQHLGELYVGLEITHWLREQARTFFVLLFIVLLSMLAVYFLANKMADKAMVPVVKSFKQQKQFVSNASHELRTPLSIIMSGMTVLHSDEDNKLSPFSEGIIEDMSDESRRMKKLIDDLLMSARSDNNTLKINPESFALQPLLKGLYSRFSLLADKKGLTLTMPDIPDTTVYADKNHLQQILIILLDNAMKYTAAGGNVALAVSASAHKVNIAVKDNGMGIAAEDLPHIFERFYRADKSRKTGGSGLGLSIAKMLAEKNGGALTAASQLGRGSCFTLTLPR